MLASTSTLKICYSFAMKIIMSCQSKRFWANQDLRIASNICLGAK